MFSFLGILSFFFLSTCKLYPHKGDCKRILNANFFAFVFSGFILDMLLCNRHFFWTDNNSALFPKVAHLDLPLFFSVAIHHSMVWIHCNLTVLLVMDIEVDSHFLLLKIIPVDVLISIVGSNHTQSLILKLSHEFNNMYSLMYFHILPSKKSIVVTFSSNIRPHYSYFSWTPDEVFFF